LAEVGNSRTNSAPGSCRIISSLYVDTNHYVGHPDQLKVFATPEAADEWFKENDPEGVVFGYEVIE
jgi:hypothetical protein